MPLLRSPLNNPPLPPIRPSNDPRFGYATPPPGTPGVGSPTSSFAPMPSTGLTNPTMPPPGQPPAAPIAPQTFRPSASPISTAGQPPQQPQQQPPGGPLSWLASLFGGGQGGGMGMSAMLNRPVGPANMAGRL